MAHCEVFVTGPHNKKVLKATDSHIFQLCVILNVHYSMADHAEDDS